MQLGIEGDRVLVIGASEGIGFETALALVKEGAQVSIVSRRAEAIAQAAHHIKAASGGASTVSYYTADITSAASVRQLVADWKDEPLDALVIAAGGSRRAGFEELDDDAWLENYAYNVLGPVRVLRGFLPALRRGRHARILLFGAAGAKMPYPHQVVSNVHKAGLLALTKTLAAELAPDGIRVNSISPGRTWTGLWQRRTSAIAEREGVSQDEIIHRFSEEIPLKRFAEAQEIAGVATFLLSRQASYILGQSISVDGGITKGLL